MRLARLALLPLLALLLLPSGDARAAWSNDPTVGLPIATGVSAQISPSAVPDGTGGMIVAYGDNGDIHALRVDATGTIRWHTVVCAASGTQTVVRATSDGAGGAVMVWQDYRSGGTADLYAQRVNASGATQWTANGVAVCTAAQDQLAPAVAANGAGAYVIAWIDWRPGVNSDVYAQVVTAAGQVGTTANGIVVCNAAGDQREIAIASSTVSGFNGAIVAWRDLRSDGGDVYAQMLVTAGNSVVNYWPANGVAVGAAAGNQSAPAVVLDPQSLALVFWADARAGTSTDVYGQRLDINGSSRWSSGGIPVANGGGSEYSIAAAPDGVGGAFIAFTDTRNATGNGDIYAQHVASGGGGMWGVSGVSVCTNTAVEDYPRIVADGAGGAIVSWFDGRFDPYGNLFAQRLNSVGTRMWTFDGVPVNTSVVNIYPSSYTHELVATPDGDALFAWTDTREYYGAGDIYATRVDHFGALGSADPVIVSVRDVPNDQGGQVKVSWKASYLEYEPWLTVSEYRLYRSAPPALAQAALRGAAISDRYVSVQEPDATTSYWELVQTLAAQRSEDYGVVAPTTSDSVAGSNPRTLFRVQARNSAGSAWWYSANDSGYSVDNLPPAAPAPLAARYAGGSTRLTWNPNTEGDLAGYRVYRGANTTFTPGSANLVGAPSDTGWVDAAGAPWVYKVTAVDAHGNESPAATVVPSGTVDAPAPAAVALELAAPQPNPARGATVLRWTLPRAGHVTLALYDGAGRRVRALHDGDDAPGAHAASFALTDDDGRALPSGAYFLRLAADGRVLARRLTVVH